MCTRLIRRPGSSSMFPHHKPTRWFRRNHTPARPPTADGVTRQSMTCSYWSTIRMRTYSSTRWIPVPMRGSRVSTESNARRRADRSSSISFDTRGTACWHRCSQTTDPARSIATRSLTKVGGATGDHDVRVTRPGPVSLPSIRGKTTGYAAVRRARSARWRRAAALPVPARHDRTP